MQISTDATSREQASVSARAAAERRRWYFGRSVLDERTHELLVDGVEVDLERKPLEVLIYLLQHAGEVCTKDELLANIWPGRVLSETVLTKGIGRLREVLQDDGQEVIKTAYGFGYRLIAPVRVEVAPPSIPPHFEFRPGDHPTNRPLWSLVERLGEGGQGEVWRARHDKTGEQRVIKFAIDESSLVALKREITLYRVINDTLAESARVVRILDWNLEQIPYFVEAEYLRGGNLLDWVKTRGSIAAIPESERIEIVAKIADALSAVHSVGVIHKDLKPSNVLMRPQPAGAPDIALADFGSGGILDAARLDALGITRLGFTKTVASIHANSSTPLYLAPEVLEGQPFTIKSDIYALGVILYQFLTGDFRKIMSPGWERDIGDELLRQDIARAAEGDPAERLANAEEFARGLRSLEERRIQLVTERESVARAERARRLLERAQARRLGLMLAFAALVAGLAVSTTLYIKTRHAQQIASAAADQAKAVEEFLSKDVFAPVSSQTEPVKDMTVLDLLRRAGDDIEARFASRPAVASELHFVIGRSFSDFNETSLAIAHFQRALELGEHLEGAGRQAAMRSASELVEIDYLVGQLRSTIDHYTSLLDSGRAQLGEAAPEVLGLRLNLARGRYFLGDWSVASRMFKDLLADIQASRDGAIPRDLLGRTHFYYAQVLTDLARPEEAVPYLQAAIRELTAALGEHHVLVAESRSALGLALAYSGKYGEADRELQRAHDLVLQWESPESWAEVRPRYFRALLFLREGFPGKAEPILGDIVRYEDENEAAYLLAHPRTPPELDHTGAVRQALGEAYMRLGKLHEAVATLRRAASVFERASGAQHPSVISTKLSLGEALIADGSPADARDVIGPMNAAALKELPATHPVLAQWYQVKGLLAIADHRADEAHEDLDHSIEIYKALYGPEDWRTKQAREDLRLLSGKRGE